jgi:hypothetical protein
VGFIFQFPAMKGTRAISRESEAERAVAREAVARSAAPLPGMPGSDIGGTEKAAADATPVTATNNTPLYIFLILSHVSFGIFPLFFFKGVTSVFKAS